MPANDVICDREEPLMGAFAALDLGLFADAADPFVATGRLIARSSGFPAFEPAGINILAAAKKRTKQFYLCLG
jgi:hypothetical protein